METPTRKLTKQHLAAIAEHSQREIAGIIEKDQPTQTERIWADFQSARLEWANDKIRQS